MRPYNPAMINIGKIRITLLAGGRLKLDGGAMFGIIPKPLWSRLAPPDDKNRIQLATTCLLVETAGRRILVETGVGNKYNAKDRDIFDIGQTWLLDSLQAAGIEAESIDTVILTHLHFDHAGGATRWSDEPGKAVLTFPRATHVVQRGEWDDAMNGHCVMTATYRAENLEPLAASGRLKLVEGDGEAAPGVHVRVLSGHTRWQQGVIICDGGQTALQPADLLPTAAHAGLRYNMAYDLLPFENMQCKSRTLAEAAHGGWTLLLGQDPNHTAYAVAADGAERYRLTAC